MKHLVQCSGKKWAVPGPHESLLESLARFLLPSLYVEIGVQDGRSLIPVLPHVRAAIGIDINPIEPLLDTDGVEVVADHLQLWQADSLDAIPWLENGSVELCFLDSKHSYEHTIQELPLLYPKMAPRGIIALHDTCPPSEIFKAPSMCGDVYRVLGWLPHHPEWQRVTFEAEFGVTLLQRSQP